MSDSVGLSQARAPDGMRIYAIGDVHGHAGLLSHMHGVIREEIGRDRPEDWRIVHVGDYVDRGPDSRGVLEFLSNAVAGNARIVTLRGNHDQGLVDFLHEADWNGVFANNGGEGTAASYGVTAHFLPETAQAERDALVAAMPPAHREFLESLPLSLALGDYFFCHAGIRPGVPLDRQVPHDLMWIRKPFLSHEGPHPKVIVHGHTPQREPEVLPNRVNIDTGIYMTGRLTSLVLEGDRKRLFSVVAD
jgi:serine/threonine protein phosphatase 1